MSNNRPKQVLLFQEDEKALGYQYEIPRTLSMRDIDVKSIDYDVEEVNKNYILVGSRPTENSVYYLHPYEKNQYVHESLGEEHFLKAKIFYLKKVARLLGAKHIVTKIVFAEGKTREIDANGECRYKVIEGGIDVKYKTEEKYKKSIEISQDVEPEEEFDLNENIDMLRSEIQELNLHHELEMIDLIDGRDSRISKTKLTSTHIRTEITSEYNRLLDISAKLSNPIFKVSAGFKDNLKIVNQIMIDVKFEF